MIMLAFRPASVADLDLLDVPCPPLLAHLLGYRGRSGYLGVAGWRRGPPRCWSGQGESWEADWRTWLAWSAHAAVRGEIARLAPSEWIVISPGEELAYHASPEVAASFLRAKAPRTLEDGPAAGEDLNWSRARLRSEMSSWLDGYAAGRAAG